MLIRGALDVAVAVLQPQPPLRATRYLHERYWVVALIARESFGCTRSLRHFWLSLGVALFVLRAALLQQEPLDRWICLLSQCCLLTWRRSRWPRRVVRRLGLLVAASSPVVPSAFVVGRARRLRGDFAAPPAGAACSASARAASAPRYASRHDSCRSCFFPCGISRCPDIS